MPTSTAESARIPGMNREQQARPESPHWLAFVVALAIICALGIFGWVFFLHIWRMGDEKAEAFSGLLAFFAAIVSSMVTVIYVYLTNASLLKAQASITLQQEELEQMKASVELQRREWEQKVRVLPQFWVAAEGEGKYSMPDPQYPGTNRVQPLRFSKRFNVVVWNYSEQSFLIESIRVQRSEAGMPPNQQMKDINLVVKPHSVEKVDMSLQVLRLLTQTSTQGNVATVLMKDLDKNARIFIRMVFSDWSQTQAETDVREFEFIYRAGDADIGIRLIRQPSDVRPSI